jgi:integrase
MASIWQDDRSGNWVIGFVFGGKHFVRSCRTKTETKAHRTKSVVEETLELLNTGRLVMPADADPGVWILSGGKLLEKPQTNSRPLARLGDVCDAYCKDQLDKADTTLVGETTHINHLKRLFGAETALESLALEAIQGYVSSRRKEDNRYGGKVSGKTIKKELTTLMQIWEWARQRGHVSHACPIKDPHRPRKWAVKMPKPEEAEKFMTWDEIRRRIARGGLASQQEKDLWKYLFLDEKLVAELLAFVKKTASHAFIYPMFAFAAYTGARRSEICRSMMDDLKFDDDLVVIRERKRRKDLAASTRQLPMHPKLKEAMQEWFKIHPGGQFTIAPPLSMPRRKSRSEPMMLSREEAHHHFKETLASGKWKVIRGYHVLRHSFGAICTRAGVPMNVIANWMGHTTDEMMRLYQHLFPQDEQSWMKKLPL